jgi:D-xylono/L-arabinono-1,4-lactonase
VELELIADYACVCGEGPVWHPLEKRLYWTDIETGRMFRYDPASGKHEQFYSGPRVGGFTVQPDGSLLLFRDKGNIALWRNGEIVKTIVKELPEEHAGRFNDVRADPLGRVFCGTLTDAAPKTGRLYRLDTDGRITKIRDDVKVANGIGFTPDLAQLYFTDTMRFTIFKFDYDRKTGAISNERIFVKTPDHEGWPDGMTVDAAGDVWSARWDGHMLVRFGPDGREKQRIEFPCKKVSCCIFGGENLTDLYVTTAGADQRAENGKTAGALYRLRPDAKGVPEFFSRIGM